MPKKFEIALAVLFLACGQVSDATPSPEDIAVMIALPQQAVCLGAKSLTLELYITNVSSRDFSISREWMLEAREYAVVYDIKEGFARIDSLQTRSDPISDIDVGRNSVKFPVGSAKRYVTTIPLDKDFFQKPAFYKARVHYWGAIREQGGTFRDVRIPSNWVLFEVESCPSKSAQ
jgi:hypothetical protein